MKRIQGKWKVAKMKERIQSDWKGSMNEWKGSKLNGKDPR